MDLRLDGQTALITGGSAGIGKGIAKAFADAGAQVMITSRKADKCEAALADIGGDSDYIASHIGQLEEAERVIDGTIERFGAIDILVNNAATNPWAGPMIDCDVPRLDKTYEVNLRAPLQWTQTAWQKWMQDNGGSIINIASVGGFTTSEALGVYCMFKDALMHMTRSGFNCVVIRVTLPSSFICGGETMFEVPSAPIAKLAPLEALTFTPLPFELTPMDISPVEET
jgi:NAD(P)-dependent dehydrogenase (short-subunit alcohol dehydrogenase family)